MYSDRSGSVFKCKAMLDAEKCPRLPFQVNVLKHKTPCCHPAKVGDTDDGNISAISRLSRTTAGSNASQKL